MSRSTRHCAPPMQVALVDVQCWQERGWANDLEREQVSTAATHVIFTHHDLVEPERLIAVQTDFRRCNSRAVEVNASSLACHPARHCALAALPGTLGARAIMPVVDVPHDHHHDLEHHAHRFSAVEVTLAPLVSRLDFLHAIATLPADVLRAKGLVCFEDDPESLNLVQRADVRGDISLLRMERLRPAASMMVLIGAGLDATSLWQHFEALELLASSGTGQPSVTRACAGCAARDHRSSLRTAMPRLHQACRNKPATRAAKQPDQPLGQSRSARRRDLQESRMGSLQHSLELLDLSRAANDHRDPPPARPSNRRSAPAPHFRQPGSAAARRDPGRRPGSPRLRCTRQAQAIMNKRPQTSRMRRPRIRHPPCCPDRIGPVRPLPTLAMRLAKV